MRAYELDPQLARDLDRAYQDGVEDLADKVVTLIRQSDYTLCLDEIEAFIEAELGYSPIQSGNGLI